MSAEKTSLKFDLRLQKIIGQSIFRAASVVVMGCALFSAALLEAEAQQAPIAIQNVDVLPMDSERVLERQTVIIRDGLVEQLGASNRIGIPSDVEVIDGSGLYLMPGLAEVHAHIPGGNAPREAIEDIMFLYIANGITAIRGMLGAPNQLTLREQTASGEVLGPTIFVGAPSLNGNTAPTPADAERLIREHKAAGYDLQKIHPGVPLAAWDRMVEVAEEVGFTFSGHVPADVGIHHALETGMSTIDHLDGYLQGVLSDEVLDRLRSEQSVPRLEQLRSVDPQKIAELARKTRELGVWNVPTMYLWENFSDAVNPDSMIALPEMQYVSPQQRQAWARQKRNRPSVPMDVAQVMNQARRDILKALSDEGALILMGTDSPQMFNVPGFALHREIRVMEAAGMSPYEILVSGTRNVAQYADEELGLESNFGTVSVGSRADLVLLHGNPLEDLDHLTDRAGVIVRGRWVPMEEIETGLAALVEKHGSA